MIERPSLSYFYIYSKLYMVFDTWLSVCNIFSSLPLGFALAGLSILTLSSVDPDLVPEVLELHKIGSSSLKSKLQNAFFKRSPYWSPNLKKLFPSYNNFITLLISLKYSTHLKPQYNIYKSNKARPKQSAYHSVSIQQTFKWLNLLNEKRWHGEHPKSISKTFTNCAPIKLKKMAVLAW